MPVKTQRPRTCKLLRSEAAQPEMFQTGWDPPSGGTHCQPSTNARHLYCLSHRRTTAVSCPHDCFISSARKRGTVDGMDGMKGPNSPQMQEMRLPVKFGMIVTSSHVAWCQRSALRVETVLWLELWGRLNRAQNQLAAIGSAQTSYRQGWGTRNSISSQLKTGPSASPAAPGM